MFSYKDMTFCPFWEECAEGHDCHRAITEKVAEGAERTGLDLCQFKNKPDCFEEKPEAS